MNVNFKIFGAMGLSLFGMCLENQQRWHRLQTIIISHFPCTIENDRASMNCLKQQTEGEEHFNS